MDNEQLRVDSCPLSTVHFPLKDGYKLTEVGVIPEEWEVTPLGNIGHIKTGPFGTLLKADEYSGGNGTPLISVREIGEGTLRVDDDTPLVPPTVVRRLPEYVLRSGDIVFGRKGAVDRSALVNESQDGWFLGSDGIRIRPTKASHPPFIAYQLQRTQVQNWLLQNATGTTMPSMNQEILRRVSLPLAPLPEQCAIAAVLSDVDALIGALDQLIAKKRDLKQAAMQQLLTGQTRLPGFSGEWEVKRLGDIALFFSGGTPSTAVAEYFAGDIPWITSGDLNQGYIRNVQGRISKSGLENSAAKMIEPNTLLIALYGATSGVTAISEIRAAINQAVLAIVPRSDDTRFLYFKLGHLKDWLITTYTQGGQPNLSGEIVKSVELSMPSLDEQTAIATVLSDMDAEIAALEQRRDKTRALKQGMMQELLTGRTRLVDS